MMATRNRGKLLEHRQPFPGDARLDPKEARQVAAWSAQARDEPCTNGIGDPDKNDGDGTALPLKCGDHLRRVREDYIGLEGDELLSARMLLACSGRREANVEAYIAPLIPPKLFEPLSERHQACLHFRIAFGISDQHADPAHLVGALRSRSERPSRRCAADKRDEMPSLHGSPLYGGNVSLLAALCSTALLQHRCRRLLWRTQTIIIRAR